MIWTKDNETDHSSLLHSSPPQTSVSRTRRVEIQRPQNSPVLISTPSSVSLEFSSDSSSSSSLSTTTISIVSQTSLSTSLLDFLDDEEEIRGEPPTSGPLRTVQVSSPVRFVHLRGSGPLTTCRSLHLPHFRFHPEGSHPLLRARSLQLLVTLLEPSVLPQSRRHGKLPRDSGALKRFHANLICYLKTFTIVTTCVVKKTKM